MSTWRAPTTRWGRLSRRIGFRGRVLLIIALTQIAYGAAQIIGGHQAVPAAWWPVSQGQVLGMPVQLTGLVWVIVGTVVATGVWHPHDRWHYALAVLLTGSWAVAAGLYWLGSGVPGSWGPAVIYTGNAAAILVISGWPEPTELPIPPGFVPHDSSNHPS